MLGAGGTQEAEGDTKSAGQGQPEKLINFSLTLWRGASNIKAFKHRGDRVLFYFKILRSSFHNIFNNKRFLFL